MASYGRKFGDPKAQKCDFFCAAGFSQAASNHFSTRRTTLPLATQMNPAILAAMRTGLNHLPEGKRRELAHVVEAIRTGFAESTARRTQARFREGKLLKIVLFGSYARGDWVEDPVGRYFSDYDLLIVVDHDDLTKSLTQKSLYSA